MEVITRIDTFNSDGSINKEIFVKNSANFKKEKVVIEVENKEYDVDGRELIKAIKNALSCEKDTDVSLDK